jgi:hypothetical protein
MEEFRAIATEDLPPGQVNKSKREPGNQPD